VKSWKVEWKGGPLDGCTEKVSVLSNTWSGPDPAEPSTKRVIYTLFTKMEGGFEYRYDPSLTKQANNES
jgi:hypothetical protein